MTVLSLETAALRGAGRLMTVFDLGANNGDDTAAYCAAGYDVVSVEANPWLATRLTDRFVHEVAEGKVRIIGAAVAETVERRRFHISANDHWSSLDPVWAGRDGRRTEALDVPCVTLPGLFDRYGVPYYLKIDVEGADRTVLEQLLADKRRPKYISIEDCRFGPNYLGLLATCGYTGFKLSEQSCLPSGTSGPFGDDLPGVWLPYREMKALYHEVVRDQGGGRIAPEGVWYDLHGRLGG